MTPSTNLRTRSLLSRLTPALRKRLLETASRVTLEKGDTVFRQGEPASAVWLLMEGWVHLIRSNHPAHADGVVIFTITPEEALCGLSAVDSEVYTTSAVAATPCRLLRMTATAFNGVLAESPAFASHVLRLVLRRMRHIARQYGSMAEPVPRRLVRALLRLREQFGDEVPMTHREVARMAWTSTETAIRVIRRLKHGGLLSGARGHIRVRNLQGLQRLLDAPAPSGAV